MASEILAATQNSVRVRCGDSGALALTCNLRRAGQRRRGKGRREATRSAGPLGRAGLQPCPLSRWRRSLSILPPVQTDQHREANYAANSHGEVIARIKSFRRFCWGTRRRNDGSHFSRKSQNNSVGAGVVTIRGDGPLVSFATEYSPMMIVIDASSVVVSLAICVAGFVRIVVGDYPSRPPPRRNSRTWW